MPMKEPQKKSWLFQYHMVVRISLCSRDHISFVPMAIFGSFVAHLLFLSLLFYSHLNLAFFSNSTKSLALQLSFFSSLEFNLM